MRVTLNGIVSADDDLEIYRWWGCQAFSPKTVRDALAANPDGEELILEINSCGGSVQAGSEIYTVLRSADIPTRAEIQSFAASSASYLSLGCQAVYMSPVAQMMVHHPTTGTSGNQTAHRQSVQMLDSISEGILNVYEAKSNGKCSREEFAAMMESETWLTAQAALDAGLVDGILYEEDGALSPANVVNALGVPDIAQLRAQYRAAHPAPAEPAPDNYTDWRAAARLEVEKTRFGGTT